MAGNDSGQEKTEEATPKRLREARKKGQVPKSRDVSTILVLIFLFGLMFAGLGAALQEFKDLMKLSFDFSSAQQGIAGDQLWRVGKASFLAFVKVMAPVLLVAFVIAALAGFLQVGALFATDPLTPQFKKLNPIEGLKNMFKTQTLIELIKNLAKIAIVFYLAYATVKGEIGTILQTAVIPLGTSKAPLALTPPAVEPLQGATAITGGILVRFVVKVLIAFLVISFVDFMVQKRQFMKQMRMTKDEVKREYKQEEGDPHIKGHRRQLQREFAFSDPKKAVRQSDVVITNPVHVAVAVKYDRKEMAAPEIVIKGQRAFAELLKDLAEQYDIPIMRNIPLAWALFELEEGSEIPEELYGAVAELLAYVYRMQEAKNREAVKKRDGVDYV